MFFNLKYFQEIPIEILSKYLARAYTYETDFYKIINYDLMKSKMNGNYKTFIKILYNGIEIKSFLSFTGKFLYRGSRINKSEVEKIFDYKNKGKLNNIVVFSKAFLSFSEDESKCIQFLGESDDKFLGILFVLKNYNNSRQESNANIQEFSSYKDEKEILFFPGSSFIIKDINYIDNNSKIKIILNYNGKFKEKYNLIYGNKTKLNNLIKTNTITKSIAGKELEFLKDGKYLITQRISNLEKSDYITNIMKAKNLENNEILYIKEIPNDDSFKEKFYNQLTFLLNELKGLNGLYSLKETFSINDSFYLVVDVYDDYLSNYLKKIKPKGLPANLIKKIMLQFKNVFLGLIGGFGERLVIPNNILIKYTNEKNNNFNVYLNENGIFKFDKKDFNLYYCHPDVLHDYIENEDIFIIKDNKIKTKNELFSLGILLYELYFNDLPFYNETDYPLYQNIFVNEIGKTVPIKIDPIKYPFIIKNDENIKYNKEREKKIDEYLKRQNIKYLLNENDFHKVVEYYKKREEVGKDYGFPKEAFSERKAFLIDIEIRRNNWIKN